jgi:FixJ family two-component response regulator
MSRSESVVFVVDDDASVRASVQRLLGSVGMRVETFASARAFLDAPRPDLEVCLVLDFQLPDLNGLEVQRHLTETAQALPIVFLTGQGDIPMTVRAMKAGAVEFLTKPFHPEALIQAVRQALERDRTSRAERAQAAGLRQLYESLTPRERDVMAGVVAGLLNKQIAGELGTSETTVKEQRGNVMRKMKAASAAALVRSAAELELPTFGAASRQAEGWREKR